MAEKGKLLTDVSEKGLTEILTRLQDQDSGKKEDKKGEPEGKDTDEKKVPEGSEKAAKG